MEVARLYVLRRATPSLCLFEVECAARKRRTKDGRSCSEDSDKRQIQLVKGKECVRDDLDDDGRVLRLLGSLECGAHQIQSTERTSRPSPMLFISQVVADIAHLVDFRDHVSLTPRRDALTRPPLMLTMFSE